jgi:Cdc6-like AAA superfamily ATPase
MAYAKDLCQVIDVVLAQPDIRKIIDQPDSPLTDEMVREQVELNSGEIWETLRSLTDEYGDAQTTLEKAETARANALAFPIWPIPLLAILYAFVFGAVSYGSKLLRGLPLNLWLVRHGWSLPSAAALVVLGAPTLGYFLYWLYWQIFRRPAVERASLKLDIDGKTERLLSLKVALDARVQSEVLRLATQLINAATIPFFHNRLYVGGLGVPEPPPGVRVTTGPGLAEPTTRANEINTKARARLVNTLENLPSASIGIAGPRGVGKTTLLGSLCSMNPRISGREVLGIYTSAPVNYDSRDFILHIYSSLCRQVLRTKGAVEDKGSPFADDGPSRRVRQRISAYAFTVGAALISASIMFAVTSASTHETVATTKGAEGKAVAAMPASIASQGGRAAAAAKPSQDAKSDAQAGATRPTDQVQDLYTFTVRSNAAVMHAFDIKPGGLLMAGLALVALGFGLRQLGTSAEDEAHSSRLLLLPGPRKSEVAEDPLVSACQRALREIRFQRSYSSGWGGELHLPAGINFSQNRAVSMAQIQQSQPELVQDFRALLDRVSREFGKVIVGIDELDKLSSDEQAEQFLNEIKSVFGVPGTYFLVSVSESAISNFERRGLPFRDAFDSAFDDVHFVNYLTLDDSRRLISRRVINLPEPFLGLTHVLAGGLPREVIRFARATLEEARAQDSANSVGEITRALVTSEATAKRRAMTFLARNAAVEPETTQFMQRLAALEEFDLLSPDLVETLKLKVDPLLGFGPGEPGGAEVIARAAIARLWREFDCFLYFSATTVELFATVTTEADWTALVTAGSIERLAKARQALELGTGVAVFQITSLRKLNGLSIPSALVVQ